jgi:O-methyltransferase domain/Dimerisation domain
MSTHARIGNGGRATETAQRIIALAYAFREAKVVLSAVELGLFNALTDGPLLLDALRARIGIHPRGARDFLDVLVALGLLDRDAEGRYSNTIASNQHLVRGRPGYLGGLLRHLNDREYPYWACLTEALRSGKALFGGTKGHYAELYSDSTDAESFAAAMSGGSLLTAQSLAERFPWQNYKTVIDVGSAEGCLPVAIALAHDHITGGGFDLPAVGGAFERYVARNKLSNRLRFYPGDFLKDPLPSGDVLVMGRILHNWDLTRKRLLLGKAYAALPPGGALIVYERLIDDDRRTSATGMLSSLNMLIMTEGGFDFSAADCVGWMQAVGFCDMRAESLTDEQSMVVGFK